MTAEKIIQQIKKDSEKEKNQILDEASVIIKEAKKQAEKESEKIISDGKKQSENIDKIMISKAGQEAKKEMMNAREKIIEECFIKAHHHLSTLNETKQ